MDIDNIIVAIKDLHDDPTTPKNVKQKMIDIEVMLKNQQDSTMNITKAIHMLEELTEDVNIQPFTRAQLLNLVAVLEMNL